MKNKYLVLALLPLVLCACSKTKELYKEHAYNSPVFDENYYLEWNGVDKLGIESESSHSLTPKPVTIHDNIEDKTNLSEIDSSFRYGYLSKLYDGRLKCDGFYQLSRVQVNKTGFATFFPKQLQDCESFGLALRGGSNCEIPLADSLNFDIHISFYKHISNKTVYEKVTYDLCDVGITTDNGGSTEMLSFMPFGSINGAVAMSINFEMKEPERTGITDDMTDLTKDHVSLMLYEVYMPGSTWL